jgi:putative membrane protein
VAFPDSWRIEKESLTRRITLMTRFILRWAINALALYVAIVVVNNTIGGIQLQSPNWTSYIWMGLIFGLVNALVRPVLKILTCPLILLTLGLFTLILNTFLFYLVGYIGTFFGVGFFITSFWSAFLGALVVSVVSVVLTSVMRDEVSGRRRTSR